MASYKNLLLVLTVLSYILLSVLGQTTQGDMMDDVTEMVKATAEPPVEPETHVMSTEADDNSKDATMPAMEATTMVSVIFFSLI